MNKTEMIDKLAKQTGLTKVQAADAVNCLFDCDSGKGIIAFELDAGNTVTIPGFGTFASSHRKARQGRNPQTGATLNIAARNVPVFRAGKSLKDRVAK